MRMLLVVLTFFQLFASTPSRAEDTPAHRDGQASAAAGTSTGESASSSRSATPTPSTGEPATKNGSSTEKKDLSEEQLAEEVSKNLENAENFDSEMAATLDDLGTANEYSNSLEKFDALPPVKQESMVQGLIDSAQGKDTAWAKKISEHPGENTRVHGVFGKEDTLTGLSRIATANPKIQDRFKRMLENGEAGERILAAQVMARMKINPTETIAARLKTETDPEVKSALVNGLKSNGQGTGDKKILDQVSAMALDKSSPEKIRQEAIQALARLTPGKETELNSSTGLKMYKMAMTEDRRHVIPAMTALIKDSSESVEIRKAALSFIGEQSDPTSIPAFVHIAAHLNEPTNRTMANPLFLALSRMLQDKPDSRIAGGIMATALPKITDAMERQYALNVLRDDGAKVSHLSRLAGTALVKKGLTDTDLPTASYGMSILKTGTPTQFTRDTYRQVVAQALAADSKFTFRDRQSLLSQAAHEIGRDGWSSDHHQGLAILLGKEAAAGSPNREWALALNESVRESLAPKKDGQQIPNVVSKGQKAFDAAFENQLAYARPKTLIPEKALGNLISNLPKWNREDYLNSNDLQQGNDHAWKSANASLAALFLAKSARYNAIAQAELDKVVKNVLSNENDLSKKLAPDKQNATQSAAHFRLIDSLKAAGVTGPSLEKATSYVDVVAEHYSGDSLSSSEELYTKQFFSLFLKEVKDHYPLSPQQKKTVEGALARTQAALSGDLAVAGQKSRDSHDGNSLMNTYGFSTSVLAAAVPPQAAKDLLQAVADRSVNPLTTTYQPAYETFVKTERGSAARNVPFHLARYQTDSDPTVRAQHRENLIQSLENYVTHAPALLSHVNRGNTHFGEEGLAPYYFYGSIPYATAALNVIASDSAATAAQKNRVENLRIGFASIVAHAANDGDTVKLGESRYPSSPIYANPLLGLSILPLIDRNEFGVLNEESIR